MFASASSRRNSCRECLEFIKCLNFCVFLSISHLMHCWCQEQTVTGRQRQPQQRPGLGTTRVVRCPTPMLSSTAPTMSAYIGSSVKPTGGSSRAPPMVGCPGGAWSETSSFSGRSGTRGAKMPDASRHLLMLLCRTVSCGNSSSREHLTVRTIFVSTPLKRYAGATIKRYTDKRECGSWGYILLLLRHSLSHGSGACCVTHTLHATGAPREDMSGKSRKRSFGALYQRGASRRFITACLSLLCLCGG